MVLLSWSKSKRGCIVTALLETAGLPETDAGLRCLACDYNLTGLTSERCPECGWTIDWDAAREVRDQVARQIDTPWARWPWSLKPLGFIVTTMQVAFTPWIFARRIPLRPKLAWPIAFGAICFIVAIGGAWWVRDAAPTAKTWLVCSLVCVFGQVVLYGLIAPPEHSRHRFRWWFVVCCYCCYPMLIEVFATGPPIMTIDGSGNIYGGDSWFGPNTLLEWSTSVVYHLWWIGLTVIAALRARRPRWWRVLLVFLSVPAITTGVTYLGVNLWNVFH